jgi:hypothetical protein
MDTVQMGSPSIMFSETHQFHIIYVPDPTRALGYELSQNNLSWVKTTISPYEFNQVEHLIGSIHQVSYAGRKDDEVRQLVVMMQEWVRTYMHIEEYD